MARTSSLRRSIVAMLILAVPVVAVDGGESAGAKRKGRKAQTADWVPFKGSLRLSRTWRHPGGHGFPSVDFDLPTGGSIKVRAAGPGTVLEAVDDCPDTTAAGSGSGCNGGEGNLVDIVHPDGRRSRYLHLREGSVVVSDGDHVCRGCVIGRSGWSGAVNPAGPAGAHIHYEEIKAYRTVPPGAMFAKHGGSRRRYPGSGGWRSLGSRQATVRNTGFPKRTPAPATTCLGYAPTIVGSGAGDQIAATSGPDIIFAGDGDDTVHGRDGADRICGGGGNDVLIGGHDEDGLDGGAGFDVCYRGETSGGGAGERGEATNCERPPFVLTVEVSTGWVVESHPPGIACPGDCSETYPEGLDVTLEATGVGTPAWSGCDTASFGSCTVAMWADRTVRV